MGEEGIRRAFLALEIPPRLRAALAEARPGWRELDADVTWVDPDRAHLTLRFLGPAGRAALEALDQRLRAIAAATAPLELRAGGTGAFPGWRRPKVLWVGLEAEGLPALAEAVEAAAREAGFAPEERRFTPHLTLGRVRGGRGAERAVQAVRGWRPATPAEPVAEIVLFSSELSSKGPRYTKVETYPLSGRAS